MSLPHPNHTFGLVTAFDLLYHRWVTADDRIVSECYRVLRPGGWLLVMDSASPILWSRHDEQFFARQRYTLGEMRRTVAAGGFRIQMLSYTNALLFPLAVAVRWLNRFFPSLSDAEMRPLPSWLNQALIRVLGLEAMWLKHRSFPIGSSLACLAQKPQSES
jgi:SAM-dependent methyltransferase